MVDQMGAHRFESCSDAQLRPGGQTRKEGRVIHLKSWPNTLARLNSRQGVGYLASLDLFHVVLTLWTEEVVVPPSFLEVAKYLVGPTQLFLDFFSSVLCEGQVLSHLSDTFLVLIPESLQGLVSLIHQSPESGQFLFQPVIRGVPFL